MSNEEAPASYVVIDVEATCDDGGSVPRDEMEIIEIGAVLVAADALQPVDEFQAFIRPVRQPRLTPFCTRLTSITQKDVDAVPGFAEVFGALCGWIDAHPRRTCSARGATTTSGSFSRTAPFMAFPYRLPHRHLNLKRAFSQQLGISKKLGMAGALAHAGLPLAGTHHRGIDDARTSRACSPTHWAKPRFRVGEPTPAFHRPPLRAYPESARSRRSFR